MFSYCYMFFWGELKDLFNWLSSLEILSSCKDGLIQIQNKSLYLFVCPKKFFSGVQICSLWYSSMMMPRVKVRYHLLKTLKLTVDELFQENKEISWTRWLRRMLQNTNNEVSKVNNLEVSEFPPVNSSRYVKYWFDGWEIWEQKSD